MRFTPNLVGHGSAHTLISECVSHGRAAAAGYKVNSFMEAEAVIKVYNKVEYYSIG